MRQVESMLQNLRRWSVPILAQCASEEDAAGERLLLESLESFAGWLRHFLLYFTPHFAKDLTDLPTVHKAAGQDSHGLQRYSNKQLVGMVLFSWHLRNSVGLRETMPSALEAMFPGFFSNTSIAQGVQVFKQSKKLVEKCPA